MREYERTELDWLPREAKLWNGRENMEKNMEKNAEAIARAIEMMKIAAEVIRDRAPDASYYYDEATCDGLCIADDLETAADCLR